MYCSGVSGSRPPIPAGRASGTSPGSSGAGAAEDGRARVASGGSVGRGHGSRLSREDNGSAPPPRVKEPITETAQNPPLDLNASLGEGYGEGARGGDEAMLGW